MQLDKLQAGDFAKVHWISGWGHIRARLMDMGLVYGSIIEVLRRAPMNGPIEIRIKGTLLSLRLEEARMVNVSPLSRGRRRQGREFRHNRGHRGRFSNRFAKFFGDDFDK